MRDIVDVFKALAEPIRIRILKMLEKKRMCVCELTAVLKVKQSSVSHHLKILKNAGFVIDIRDGLWIDYELEKKRLNKEFLRLEGEIHSCMKKLESGDFLSKAPISVVDREKERLASHKKAYQRVSGILDSLK